jgi:alkanesulfonate monooxygenase SsuD/methylene tetrahydromethanopterin reductase-like flavin-dependent oxidoreductase (luciferase family)
MTEPRRLSFGVKTSQMGLTYEQILATWREADELPVFEHAWLWDHMVPLRGDIRAGALEAWTLLAALAAQTNRLRIGVMVTSNRLRPPAVLAKMAATVDVISDGRLVLGVGVGGSRLPAADANPAVREHEAYGIPLVPAAEAIADLADACTIFKRMWTEPEPFDFHGRRIELTGAVCEPKPVQAPHPPIMIGAAGEKLALRVVAEHADIWSCPARTVEEFRHKSRILDEHCAAIGRDPGEIVRSVQTVVRTGDASEPAATRELLLGMIEAGATHLVLAPVPAGRPLRWLVDEVVESVRAQAQPR